MTENNTALAPSAADGRTITTNSSFEVELNGLHVDESGVVVADSVTVDGVDVGPREFGEENNEALLGWAGVDETSDLPVKLVTRCQERADDSGEWDVVPPTDATTTRSGEEVDDANATDDASTGNIPTMEQVMAYADRQAELADGGDDTTTTDATTDDDASRHALDNMLDGITKAKLTDISVDNRIVTATLTPEGCDPVEGWHPPKGDAETTNALLFIAGGGTPLGRLAELPDTMDIHAEPVGNEWRVVHPNELPELKRKARPIEFYGKGSNAYTPDVNDAEAPNDTATSNTPTGVDGDTGGKIIPFGGKDSYNIVTEAKARAEKGKRPRWRHSVGDVTDRSKELARFLAPTNEFFSRVKNTGVYYVNEGNLVEIDPVSFLALLEEHVEPVIKSMVDDDEVGKKAVYSKKPATVSTVSAILKARVFRNSLPIIERVLDYSMPFLTDGEVVWSESGYSEKLKTWTNPEGPQVRRGKMSLDEAQAEIRSLYQDFCFREDTGTPSGSGYDDPIAINGGMRYAEIVAIAHLFTPFCRGLMNETTSLVPSFIYKANRQRSGKDYCAEIPALVHLGFKANKGPVSSRGDEELRKVLTSLLVEGTRLAHFENNKGTLSSGVLEAAITSETIGDRILGKTKSVTCPNECVFSLSMNEASMSTDLANRSLFCNLAFFDLDPNGRSFAGRDPHAFLTSAGGRETILEALGACIDHWIKQGMPPGKTLRTSQPSWAKVVGGIMVACGLGDPCAPIVRDHERDDVTNAAEDFASWLWRKGARDQGSSWTFTKLRGELKKSDQDAEDNVIDPPYKSYGIDEGGKEGDKGWQRLTRHLRQGLRDRELIVESSGEKFASRLCIDDTGSNPRFHRVWTERIES